MARASAPGEEMRMEWIRFAPSLEATFGLPGFGAHHVLRDVVRGLTVLGFAGVLAYCLHTAWAVLRQLQYVKLADMKHALDVVSVRDAVLCGVGYRVGTELLRAAVRARRQS
jgi:hypothetical protein